MSSPIRSAALPPSSFRKTPVLDADGLVLRPVSGDGKPLGVWDFRDSPGPLEFAGPWWRRWPRRDGAGQRGHLPDQRPDAAAVPQGGHRGRATRHLDRADHGGVVEEAVRRHLRPQSPGRGREAGSRGAEVPDATQVFIETPRRRPPASPLPAPQGGPHPEELKTIRTTVAATVP